jgi:tetratricopeptide (TPR) repeat protein
MRFPRLTASLAFLLLAACGGGLDGGPRRTDGAPLAGMLAGPAHPAAADLLGGHPAQARAKLESALASDPDGVFALADLGVAYALEERVDAARQLLEEALARGGAREQQAALVNLAELYALDGYLTAAQAHLASARAIDPARPEPVYALALLASARGDRAGALALAREAVRLDDGGAARRSLAFAYPEERLHLSALVAAVSGEPARAEARWRELARGRFPVLAQAAQRHLDER